MIRIFNIHDPICATCEYWIEKDKNIGFQSKQMFIEYGHVQGKCLSENNTLRNPHERICKNYKHWHILPEKK